MDLGSLVASFGADLTPLQRSVAKAKTLYNEYQRTVETKVARATFAWMKHGKRITSTISAIHSKIFNLKTALLALGSGMVVRGFVNVASSFEQMRIKLDALTKGKGAETLERFNAWALEMPVNTQKAVDTFAMMKAMGLDPTLKSMETLVDISVLFGEEAMTGVARALGQIKLLGRLSAQELNQLANAGIAARKYLTEAFGTGVADEINRMGYTVDQVIHVIMEGMKKDFGGAAKMAMSTWRGVTDYLKSVIVEFQRVLAQAGIFDFLKNKIKSIADNLFTFLKAQIKLKKENLPNVFDRITEAATSLLRILESLAGILITIGRIISGLKIEKILTTLANVVEIPGMWAQATKGIGLGMLSFGEFASSDFGELKTLLEKRGEERQKLLDIAYKYAKMGVVDTNKLVEANLDTEKLKQLVAEAGKRIQEIKQTVNQFGNQYQITVVKGLEDVEKKKDKIDLTPKINLKKYNELLKQLQFQIDLLGKTETEQKALTLIKQLDIKLTEEQKNKIKELVNTLHQQQEALKIKDQYDALIKSLRQELDLLGKTNEEQRIALLLAKFDGKLTTDQVKALKNLIAQIERKKKALEDAADEEILVKRIIEETKSATEKYNEELVVLNNLLAENKITQEQYDEAVQNLKTTYGLIEDETKSLADTMSAAFEGWANNFSYYLNEILWDSKITFEEIAKAFAKMVTQMVIQTQIIQPLFGQGGIIPNLFKGGGTNATKKHSGGVVGVGGIYTPIPKLHNGLMPNEYMAVLRKGEAVFTPEQLQALGRGANVNIIINNNSAAKTNVEERVNPQGGKDIIVTIDEALGEMISNDVGKVSRALRTRGLSPNIVRR